MQCSTYAYKNPRLVRYNEIMQTFTYSVWFLVETLLALTLLAGTAGFSITLYATQAGIAATPRRSRALIAGVAAAIVCMLGLFQLLHVDTLISMLDSTARALAVNAIVNTAVGAACLYGGMRYLTAGQPRTVRATPSHTAAYGLIGFAFLRTFVSLSGLTATFIGGNLISEVSPGIGTHLFLTVLFVAAAIAPLAGIAWLARRYPTLTHRVSGMLRTVLRRVPYRTIIGYSAAVFGGVLIVFQLIGMLT